MNYFFEQIANGLSLGSIYALIALGFSMVYGVLKLLNFAHSELFASGAFIGYVVLSNCHIIPGYLIISILFAFLIAGVGVAGLAVLLERIAYRPLYRAPRVTILLSAIGISKLLQELGIQIFGSRSRAFLQVSTGYPMQIFLFCVLLACFWILHFIVNKTRFGIEMRAVSENPETARLFAIKPNSIYTKTFFLGGFFAGVAGVVWGLQYNTIDPQMGFLPGLKAFTIAVVGSIGNLKGSLIIGLSLGIIETLFQAYLPSDLSGLRDIFAFLVLLIILAIRPYGIMGERGILK